MVLLICRSVFLFVVSLLWTNLTYIDVIYDLEYANGAGASSSS